MDDSEPRLGRTNVPVTGEFPVQIASNVENVSSWWVIMLSSQFSTDILPMFPVARP